ncbi:DNA mismatch repair protein MutL [Firmicutes bacterium M10-2]|nr:DNA mismatch repair protein MutL [Firmicutes bacterium M10-2]
MSKIHILDEHLSNMIAAGEVVERPANIVKECVENSIDAKATSISIEAWEGGIDKLIIIDDGYGMSKEDASLSFIRHATSKIKDEDDLFNIQTMGFRGEALPSIASVSHVEMQTNNGKESTKIVYDYGKKVIEEKTNCPAGTKIEVTGLFYKTPARFKYLRKPNYEFSVIAEWINKLALSYPKIRFSLSHNGRLIFQTSGKGNILEIIYQMYGKDVAASAEPFDEQTLDFRIHGYGIQPKINRSSKYFIFISVNHRLVRSIPIQNAIIETYHEFMPPNRYPIFLIDIEVDPQLVDVNVHPNKLEIRMTKQNELIDLIKETIKKLFQEKLRTVEIDLKRIQNPQESVFLQEPPASIKQDRLIADDPIERLKEEVKEQKNDVENAYEQEWTQSPISYESHKQQFMEMIQEEPEPFEPKAEKVIEQIEEKKEIEQKRHERGQEFFNHLRIIGQLRFSYILCENENGLVIIDQHAAQERYNYERLMNEFKKPHTVMQPLMVPVQIHVSHAIMAHIDSINERVQLFGIHFEAFGNDHMIVREIPTWLNQCNEQEFLEDLISLFMQDLHVDIAKIQKHMIATIACHSSIRFNKELSKEEMEQVIKDLQKCEQPYHCPHGRPTVITLSDSDLRKEFERG